MQSILVPQGHPVGESRSNESLSSQVGKQFSRIAENALQPAARKSSQKLISSSHRFSSVGGIPQSHHVKKSNRQPTQKQDSVSMRPTNSPTSDSNCPFEESRIHPSPPTQVNFELGSSTDNQASGQSKRRSTSSFRTSSTSSKPSGMLSRQYTDSSGSGRFAYLDSPGILKAAPSCPGFLDPVQTSKFQPTVSTKTAEGQPMPLLKSSECRTEIGGNAPIGRLRVNTTTAGLEFYRIQETIGTGNFSQVKLATHILTKGTQSGKLVAKYGAVKLQGYSSTGVSELHVRTLKSCNMPSVQYVVEEYSELLTGDEDPFSFFSWIEREISLSSECLRPYGPVLYRSVYGKSSQRSRAPRKMPARVLMERPRQSSSRLRLRAKMHQPPVV
ncbi:hypothetical protein T265_03888 [Opisthorchis viverrini]|uniref:Protein kinase domain-containing protein n=1 Tax=Opisthorchis viverrini TaxID=6198 RepID=A0A074ZQ09_OPIVI|nr:hypothetical protein T265_03888 [Opisthorchis viverrini]KER29513.1 hypothetical protein T265_03888 [Opisthorchis viverrini]